MSEGKLWQLIESARESAPESEHVWEEAVLVGRAVDLLAERGRDEIIAMHRELREAMAASYRESLWAAAYLLNGGCSDDGFEYFRGWLITQGREVFESAIADPDSLAAVPAVRTAAGEGMELECEDTLNVAVAAYGKATGEDPGDALPHVRYPQLDEPDWQFDFDDDDAMARKLPRLSALCG
jgi:hypothetical protein